MKKKILALVIFCLIWNTTTLADHEVPEVITDEVEILVTLTLEHDVLIKSGGSLIIRPLGTLFTGGYNISIEEGGLLSVEDLVDFHGTLHIHPDSIIDNAGTIANDATGTTNISGTIYNYNTITNGNSATAGTFNINYPGALFLLGGKLENGVPIEGSSITHINQGGALYNYYGTITVAPPEAQMILYAGGKFHNVRGSNNPPTTINAGGAFFDGSEVTLDRDIDINYTWTIYDKAVINGNGNEITFGPNGGIVIDKDASLLLEDIFINDVSGNKIRCIDSNSTLSINKVTWTQDANFTFTWGTIYVAGDWTIQGKNTTFTYISDQDFTIASNITLHLNQTIFNYDTTPNNRIKMTDFSSVILLDRATWLASQACTLATGSLYTTGLATLWGNGVTLDISGLAVLDINGDLKRVGTVV